jgi:hypothetical protein
MPLYGSMREEDKEFYYVYGRAMSNWADIEVALGNLFLAITGMPAELGRPVFFSARSFLGRAEMLASAIPTAKTVPAGKRFLSEAVTLARTWQSIRNILAHEPHDVSFTHPQAHRVIRPISGKPLRAPQIAAAANNFGKLVGILDASLGASRLLREPELSLSLLARLPMDALQDMEDWTLMGQLLRQLEQSPN